MADRAVSTVVGYVLTLGIVAILVSTLMVSFAPFVTNQQQDTAGSALAVFGNDLAGDIDSADRLATRAGTDGAVSVRTRLPDRVGGSHYEIEIDQVGVRDTPGGTAYDYEITLRTVDFDTNVIVSVRTRTPVEQRTGTDALDGGTLLILYDAADDQLVIQNG